MGDNGLTLRMKPFATVWAGFLIFAAAYGYIGRTVEVIVASAH